MSQRSSEIDSVAQPQPSACQPRLRAVEEGLLIGVPYMALILAAVLGQQVTPAGVLEAGVWPFILPGLIKAAAAALLIPAAWLLAREADRRR